LSPANKKPSKIDLIHEAVRETAALVRSSIEELGGEADLWGNPDFPIVYGRLAGASPKTPIMYGMYDSGWRRSSMKSHFSGR